MIGLATHPAMPIRIDTDTSWAHTAKETAAPFRQSVSSPPKPVTFPSPTRPEPFTRKGLLEMSVWLIKSASNGSTLVSECSWRVTERVIDTLLKGSGRTIEP